MPTEQGAGHVEKRCPVEILHSSVLNEACPWVNHYKRVLGEAHSCCAAVERRQALHKVRSESPRSRRP